MPDTPWFVYDTQQRNAATAEGASFPLPAMRRGAASKSGVPNLVLKKFDKLQTTKYSKRIYGAILRIAIRAQIAHKIFRIRSRSSSLYFHHASAGSAGLKRIGWLADQLIRVQVSSHGFVA